MRKILGLAVFVAVLPLPAYAQSAAHVATPAPPRPHVVVPIAQAATAPPARATAIDPRIDPSDANVKFTITVTDKNTGVAGTKTVTLTVANLGSGRVRSSGLSPIRSTTPELNVDATAELRKSGMIRTNLSISYVPEQLEDTGSRLTIVNESLSLFLKDGVATVVTQSADPTKGSRSVTIEVTANVIK